MRAFESELNVLLNVPRDELLKVTNEKIADAIMLNREGKIKVVPGYDGEYGVPILGAEKQRKAADAAAQRGQKSLGDY